MSGQGFAEWPTGENGPSLPGAKRWALIVGIAKYADPDLKLRFADKDAIDLRKFLRQPHAGAFQDDNVRLLVNEDATEPNIRRALRSFLKLPGDNDLVVLFFACHGAKDPDRLDELYLLPHDAEENDVSGTCVPMSDIDAAVRRLNAKRVVVVMDTCHSGALSDAFKRRRASANAAADLNAYLNALSQSRAGVSVMTSAMANESAIEGDEWGAGHGVFTHYLLEGLRGRAIDHPPFDGLVTVGRLFDYVEQKVREDTKDRQHPHISPGADRDLLLATTRSLSADQHLELARRLTSAAEFLSEPTVWRGAAAQYDEVARLRRDPMPAEMVRDHAIVRFRAGDAAGAEVLLRPVAARVSALRSTLALVQAAQGRAQEAMDTVRGSPEPWAPLVFRPVQRPRVALLVGVDVLEESVYGSGGSRLRTCVAELQALGRVLRDVFGFDRMISLFNKDARTVRIWDELRGIVAESQGYDAFVLALSGHGVQEPSAARELDASFVAFDGQITSAQIDDAMRRVRATRATLIVSIAHSGRFADRASGYDVMAACGANEFDTESTRYGVFLEALLPSLSRHATLETVIRATRAGVDRYFQKRSSEDQQHPVFKSAGDLGRPPFVDAHRGPNAPGAPASAAALLGVTTGSEVSDLIAIGQSLKDAQVSAEVSHVLAIEWWHRRVWSAVAELPRAPSASAAANCARVWASVRAPATGFPRAALEELARVPSVAADAPLLRELRALIEEEPVASPMGRVWAVLIGLPSAPPRGNAAIAAENVAAVRHALLGAGIPETHIAQLLGQKATVEAIRRALRRAAGEPIGRRAVLIYWFGSGTLAALNCANRKHMSSSELASLAGANATLLAEGVGGEASPGTSVSKRLRLAITAARADPAKVAANEATASSALAPLAATFVEVLRTSAQPIELTAASLYMPSAQAAVHAATPDAVRLFADPVIARVDWLVDAVRAAELARASDAVATLLRQRGNGDPEALLQRGVLAAAAGATDEAVAALGAAAEQFVGQPRGEALARMHLARTLLESGRDRARAVSECRLANARDATLSESLFWLGRAIAELIQNETRAQAADALRKYISSASPLRRSEAMFLLGTLEEQPPATARPTN